VNPRALGRKLFTYPKPLVISEEERRRYQEIAERLAKGEAVGTAAIANES
jgi:hypothetical protein